MRKVRFHFPISDDEITYRTVSRYALISGLRHPVVLNRIYKNSKKRIPPYLPGLNSRFSNYFGLDASEVVLNRTLFPLIAYAQSDDAEYIKHSLVEDSEAKASPHCAISQTRIKFFYGSLCLEKDLKIRGFPYWHVMHQVHGV